MKTIQSKQITIQADKNCSPEKTFLDTGIALTLGQLLIVDVDPLQTWSPYAISPKSQVDANGISVVTKKIDGIYREEIGAGSSANFEFPFGSLIGTVDGGKTYFPVGTHLEMTVLTAGTLSLVFWGGDRNTNAGSTAKINVLQPENYNENFDKDFLKGDYFDIHAKVHGVAEGTLLNTGINLEIGDILTMGVDSQDLWSNIWNNTTWNAVNANGIAESDGKSVYGTYSYNSFPFTYASLVGTLNEGKTYFPIGTHLKMTVLTPGRLSLVCWDSVKGDNMGSVRTFVNVVRRQLITPDGIINTEPNKTYKVQVTVDFPVGVGYSNTFGIFAMSDDGSVAGVKPDAPNYAQTVVTNRIQIPKVDQGGYKKGDTFQCDLPGGPKYGVFLISNGTPIEFLAKHPTNQGGETPLAYFFNTVANPDKISHVRTLSSNQYGFEDQYGGGDQNFMDLVVKLETLSVS
ncbi:MAG: DUF4114 domain-containing protein [Rhizonema sp. PD38]|nr:DUF4114 domain-containing protein [Rhizonema sp. PD38]